MRVRTEINHHEPLFDTMLFIDGIPTYYSVAKEENKFNYAPSYENVISALPSFTIWNAGDGWYIETANIGLTERETIDQAVEKVERYYLYD